MTTHDFDCFLANGPAGEAADEAFADRLFERFEGDATPARSGGEDFVSFTLEASSLGAAMALAVEALEAEGYAVRRVEVWERATDLAA